MDGLVQPNVALSADPKPSGLSGLSKVAVGGQPGAAICGIDTGGGVSCIGSNAQGLLGIGGSANSTTPVTPVGMTSGATDISLASHACAIRAAALWCWGENPFGQAGPTTSATPVQVAGVANAMTVKTNGTNTCVLHTDGTVSCLGANFNALLGSGSGGSSSLPVQIPGIAAATSLSMASSRACVTASGGSVRCWGSGFGQPAGAFTVAGISNATKVAVGNEHACVLLGDATVSCFDRNFTSTVVAGLNLVVDIESGGSSMFARTSSGAVYKWGSNIGGALADGTGFYFTPQKVVV